MLNDKKSHLMTSRLMTTDTFVSSSNISSMPLPLPPFKADPDISFYFYS
jgi:hypothetical protein